MVRLGLSLVLALLLAACSTSAVHLSTHTSAGSNATVVASTPTSSGGAASSSTPAATPSTASGGTPSSTGESAGTTAATPSSAVTDAIKSVIQRANQEQQQAYASQDPTVMQDTSTASYYNELVQGLQDLSSSGVSAIKLDNLNWGDITLQGMTTARATTSETWTTTLRDGSSSQETDTNVYTLVLQNGVWRIQDDQHPDSGPQPSGGQTTSTDGTGSSGATDPVTVVDPTSTGESSNWSGYYATGGTFTAVSGTWTVPTVSAGSSAAADATWVGIGGVRSTDLIQAGTDAILEGGQVSYEAWIEMLPQSSKTVPLTVHAGDSVSVSITQQADGTWQIAIKDLTTTQSYRTNVSYTSSRSSAEWIEESPAAGRGMQMPLDNFGSVSFSGAMAVVDDQQETIQQAGGQAITMKNSFGQALAQPSTLGSDGRSFSVARTSTLATVVGTQQGGRRRYP